MASDQTFTACGGSQVKALILLALVGAVAYVVYRHFVSAREAKLAQVRATWGYPVKPPPPAAPSAGEHVP